MYRTCANCGSNLDPNERCDCEKDVVGRKNLLMAIGSKVRVMFAEEDHNYEPIVGSVGKVAAVEEDMIAVELDDLSFKGHNCSGNIPSGRGYWCLAEDIIIV